MPSRVEKNNNHSKTNKRTIKNQELYTTFDTPDYKVISSTNNFFEEKEELVEKTELPSILKTEKLSAFIMDDVKERDINKVLKTAKSTRNREDELEKKRKLDKKEYNITKKINVDDDEAVSKFRNQNKRIVENEEELSNLINTIYSKNDSDNLLDNLMPSSLEETIVSDDAISGIVIQDKKEKKKIENSFFTSSLELSEEDLEEIVEDDENDEKFFDDEKFPTLKVISAIVGTILLIATIGFVVYEIFLKI